MTAVPFAYLESSALLRIILEEQLPKVGLLDFESIYTSRITQIECYRVFNRLFLERKLSEARCAAAIQRLRFILRGLKVLNLHERILRVAESSWPAPITTLDAIHLATALYLRDENPNSSLFVLTHDQQLARGAQTLGLSVAGVE
jgi:predicted nucleic acid-binding protein